MYLCGYIVLGLGACAGEFVRVSWIRVCVGVGMEVISLCEKHVKTKITYMCRNERFSYVHNMLGTCTSVTKIKHTWKTKKKQCLWMCV